MFIVAAEDSALSAAAFVLAVLGFTLSAGLGAVKVWETFLRKSRWKVRFDWLDPETATPTLLFSIANVENRRDGIREIRFGMAETPSIKAGHVGMRSSSGFP